MKLCAAWIAVLLAMASAADAAPRTWTSADGRSSVEADLLGFEDGKVSLRKAGGQTVRVALEKLSEADQAFVKASCPAKPVAAASAPLPATRTWSSAGGKYTLRAELVGVEEGKVRLRKPGGDVVAVALEKLSEEDQRFVKLRNGTDEREGRASLGGESPNAESPERPPHTWALRLKHVMPPRGKAGDGPPADYSFRPAFPQIFADGLSSRPGSAVASGFSQVIRSEPEYRSAKPLRGVARLGDEQYGFTVDAASSSKGSRLYFDLNHNGDLTDDEPIEADPRVPGSAAAVQFPPVDLELTAGGAKYPYAFVFTYASGGRSAGRRASGVLTAAVYREGEITLANRRRRVVLLDNNSNGRFDDPIRLQENLAGSEGQVYLNYGDLLLLDPDRAAPLSRLNLEMGPNRVPVSKLVGIDGQYYDLKVSPGGEQISLRPTGRPIGRVTTPSLASRAIVYSDAGEFVPITGGQSKPVSLPEGEWKLASCVIEAGGAPAAGAGPRTRSSGPPGTQSASYVTARATRQCQPIKVRQGETVEFPFGPPYKPIVKAYPIAGRKEARLQLLLVGAGGEICSSMVVGGSRPQAPEFVITNDQGDVLQRGKFQYG